MNDVVSQRSEAKPPEGAPPAERNALALENLHSLFEQAPAALAVMRGPTHVFVFANPAYHSLIGYRPTLGRPVREVFPEVEGQGYFELLDEVYRTGKPWEGRAMPVRLRWTPDGPEENRFFNIVYQAMRGADGTIEGVMVFAFDVTVQVEATRLQAEIAERLRQRNAQLALAADVGLAFSAANDLRAMLQRVCEAAVTHLGVAFARIWTVNEAGTELELQASAGLYTHLDGAHARVPVGKFKIGLIAQEAKPHLINDVQHDPRVGDRAWAEREGMVAFAGYPLMIDNRVIGVIAMFARQPLGEDVLDALASVANTVAIGVGRKRAQQWLEEERETLETLNQVGKVLAAELDLGNLVQAITDSATKLSGAQFGAFFYNTVDRQGERYTLYAISGVPREAFSKFPMPRNTAVFAPTFAGEGIVRVDDITQDPRYGKNAPHHGMPKGHLPVVSYLAVPVVSRSREVIGGLFFGHPEPGVFTERAEKLVAGVAAQAAIAMDNARLFAEAQRLISALERSNADLDQFAYVASHDLKAPLRGISNLSQWLEEDLGPTLEGEPRRQLRLLRGRVARMEALIDGILSYSRAGRNRASPEQVDVRTLLREVVELLSPKPPVTVVAEEPLPQVTAEKVQLQQVLMNLINNALRHGGREDLRVTVRVKDRGPHWEFEVQDNGVGIPPEFQERIWGIFQTLEARDKVESTGIGLAIVKRVVEARGGRATVHSVPGQGATFAFTWPKQEARR